MIPMNSLHCLVQSRWGDDQKGQEMTFKKGDPKPPGSGMKKGDKPKRPRVKRLTDEQRKLLANQEGGITPLEFYMSVLRDPDMTFKEKHIAASELMPYLHRKMPTAVDLTANTVVTNISPTLLAKMPEEELAKLMLIIKNITQSTT